MRYKKIGDTEVPAIGQGTGGVYNSAIIRAGIDAGLSLIDTAESYGNEGIVGEAIKGQRDKVFLSTKFLPEHNGYDDVIKACEGSLKRLGTDYIDLYSVYYRNPNIPEEETAKAFDMLIQAGKIKSVGICNTYRPMIANIQTQAVQTEFNLLDRSAESKLLPFCSEFNIAVLAYSPLRDYHFLNPDSMMWLREMAGDRTLPQIILSWLISHAPVIALTSSSKVNHIKRNAQAGDFQLSEGELRRIDELFKPEVVCIPLNQIDVTLSADKFPQTEEDAIDYGKWAIKPQDIDLKDFKPIKVERCAYDDTSRFPSETYEVKEGGLRYWAWRIQKNEPIPAIVKHRWIQDFRGIGG